MASAIRLVLDALKATLQADEAMKPDIQIVHGPPIVDIGEKVIAVGYARPPQPAASTSKSAAGLSAQRDTVRVRVMAAIVSGDSDPDLSGLLTQVDALAELVEAAIARDRQLGGVVADARVTGADYLPVRTGQGVDLAMEITVEAEVIS